MGAFLSVAYDACFGVFRSFIHKWVVHGGGGSARVGDTPHPEENRNDTVEIGVDALEATCFPPNVPLSTNLIEVPPYPLKASDVIFEGENDLSIRMLRERIRNGLSISGPACGAFQVKNKASVEMQQSEESPAVTSWIDPQTMKGSRGDDGPTSSDYSEISYSKVTKFVLEED